jgi:carbon monoxide dehydrogenase subunit G
VRVDGSYTFRKSREEVWKALQDPQTLAATLPGVKRLEVVGPDRYAVTAHVGVGSVKGLFDGTFSVEDKKDFESCMLRGSARGASGAAQVEAAVRLSDGDAGGATLHYDADATISGPIAGVGQRMIAAASRKMAGQFFSAVDRYDATAAAGEARAPSPEAAPAGQVFERPPAPASDTRAFVRGVAVGFALALIGVAVGRWTAR